MTVEKHQELISLIELMVLRVGMIDNPIDQEIYRKVIKHLIELQSRCSKEL